MDEQLAVFRTSLSRNYVLMDVMGSAAALDLHDWYLTAGWSTREQQFCAHRGSGLLASIDIDAYHQLARREAS